jgi:hypothetical protein
MRYIFANPVRAGLVSNYMDYEYSGSFTHAKESLFTEASSS